MLDVQVLGPLLSFTLKKNAGRSEFSFKATFWYENFFHRGYYTWRKYSNISDGFFSLIQLFAVRLCVFFFDARCEGLVSLYSILSGVFLCTLFNSASSAASQIADSHWVKCIRLVRASDSQCRSRNCPGFDPRILRHSGIWGAAD